MRFPVRLLVIITTTVSFVATSLAGAQGAASLSGRVTTVDGRSVPQVVVRVESTAGTFTTVTGPSGAYRFRSLPAGTYAVTVSAPGLELAAPARVEVTVSEARLDLDLAPAPIREQVLVTATRGEATLSSLGVSATVLDRDRIVEREASSLLPLLEEVPGVTVARAGAIGRQASAFVRGGESFYARVMIDGVPVNSPGGAYDFASQLALDLDQVEVVRGATSSLYGTDALAGVIHLITRRATPGARPELGVEVEAGEAEWRRAHVTSSGARGRVDWSMGLGRLHTDRDPNGLFEQTTGSASVGFRLADRTSLRVVTRATSGSAGVAGQYAYGPPDLEEYSDRSEYVLGGRLDFATDRISHQVRMGYARVRQLSADPVDSGVYLPASGDKVALFPSFDFVTDGYLDLSRRVSAGYQIEAHASPRHLLTAGLEIERESGELGFVGEAPLAPVRTNTGFYVQDRFVAGESVFLTLGGRIEDNESYGVEAVPRAAVAWRPRGSRGATTVKASAGTGIKEPSFLQSFGDQSFAMGNPELKPERSRTFDVGVEQRMRGDRLRAEGTYFYHSYRDQIAYTIVSFDPFVGTYENLGETRARGLELALEAAPSARSRLLFQYTFTDGEIVESTSTNPLYAQGESLLRRPRHQASITGSTRVGRVHLGASGVVVGRRADSDFLGLDLRESERYARVDLRASVDVGKGLEAFVVGENVLDRDYQEVLGYPALGRVVRAGIRLRVPFSRP